jgi:hypothetical protein
VSINCATCRWWEEFWTRHEVLNSEKGAKYGREEIVPLDETIGSCRRFPPTIARDGYEEEQHPQTRGNVWCGEWSPSAQTTTEHRRSPS